MDCALPVSRTMIVSSFGRYLPLTAHDHEAPGSGVRRMCRLRGPCTPSTRISSMSLVADGPEIRVCGRAAGAVCQADRAGLGHPDRPARDDAAHLVEFGRSKRGLVAGQRDPAG